MTDYRIIFWLSVLAYNGIGSDLSAILNSVRLQNRHVCLRGVEIVSHRYHDQNTAICKWA